MEPQESVLQRMALQPKFPVVSLEFEIRYTLHPDPNREIRPWYTILIQSGKPEKHKIMKKWWFRTGSAVKTPTANKGKEEFCVFGTWGWILSFNPYFNTI